MRDKVRTGRFEISSRRVLGELVIAGPKSSLILRDDAPIAIEGQNFTTIVGQLFDSSDRTHITLLHCVQTSYRTWTAPKTGTKSYSVTFFPHFVVEGRYFLGPDEPIVKSISFRFKDAESLFNDRDAFGLALDAESLIATVAASIPHLKGQTIKTGQAAMIGFFAGQITILQTQTTIGAVELHHQPSTSSASARGVRIRNKVWLTITPPALVSFSAACDSILRMLGFICIAAGRRQTLKTFELEIHNSLPGDRLHVNWSNYPKPRRPRSGQRDDSLLPHDLPFDPIRRRDEFLRTLQWWFQTDPERLEARSRVEATFALQNLYSPDRLVAAANAFDLLPQSAVPKTVQVTDEVKNAAEECKSAFRQLPPSDEREAILNAIGRVGRATLKQKVRYRAAMIMEAKGGAFFNLLDFVCDRAVEARNHYVHGSELKFEPENRILNFLTDTLEFVFLASELIESGWNLERFIKAGTSMTHPFGTYYVRYRDELEHLRASVKQAKAPGKE